MMKTDNKKKDKFVVMRHERGEVDADKSKTFEIPIIVLSIRDWVVNETIS